MLVIFFSRSKDFESIVVHSHTTVNRVLEDRDIEVQLSLRGITNQGLFLKTPEEETPFSSTECPCEVLFETGGDGVLKRQAVGKWESKEFTKVMISMSVITLSSLNALHTYNLY